MKKMYLVTEKSTEYNDEYYNITEGYVVKNGFVSKEAAQKEAAKQNREFLECHRLCDFDYPDVHRILSRSEYAIQNQELLDEWRDDYNTSFKEIFTKLEEDGFYTVAQQILDEFDMVTVVEVEIQE